MKISYIPYGNIASVVPALLPHFKTAEKWSEGRVCVDDLVRMALNDLIQLWVVHEGTDIHGFFGVEVKMYPRCKMLAIQYCAMEPGIMAEVEDEMQKIAATVAAKSGCAGVEFVGRPGWKKVADANGYTVQSVMYQKFFKEPV